MLISLMITRMILIVIGCDLVTNTLYARYLNLLNMFMGCTRVDYTYLHSGYLIDGSGGLFCLYLFKFVNWSIHTVTKCSISTLFNDHIVSVEYKGY